jgi:GntR family transcriptional repressor for pyruvate dehydrogenase complex
MPGETRTEVALEAPAQARRLKTAHVLADKLKELIISTGLAHGERLQSDRQLMERYGYGRGTIREALRILENEGIIAVKPGPNGGIFTQHIGYEGIARTLAFLVHQRGISAGELLSARRELEVACGYLAALDPAEGDIKALRSSVEKMEKVIGDSAAVASENLNFHLRLVEASKNQVLYAIIGSLRHVMYEPTLPILYSVTKQNEAVFAHAKIVEAIAAREPDVAARRIRKHLSVFESYVTETQQSDLLLKPLTSL